MVKYGKNMNFADAQDAYYNADKAKEAFAQAKKELKVQFNSIHP